jgi:arginyl-tRNA synthetase
MRFDIEEVSRQSMENPVFYVQYGHARIASILRKAAEAGVALRPIEDVDLGVLVHDAELDLLRSLASIPESLARAAELRAPHRIAHAAQDVAARFHRFYTECRVVGEDAELTQARLWLCSVSKQVLANLLVVLGVAAPERMERDDAGE